MNRQWLNWTAKKPLAFYAGLLFFVCAIGLISWSGWQINQWSKGQQNALISEVKLYGNFSHLQAEQLHQKISQQYVGNFFRVNVDQVQQFLQQQPWVYQAAVRKQWPDILVVVVTEQQPVAVWNEQQLINSKGQLFTAPLEQLISPLPMLAGPQGTEQDALTMFQHMQGLLSLHNFRADKLWLNERFSWQLTLENGVALKLGREDTLKRLQRFVELYPVITKHSPEAVTEVDLRYDTGMAVRYANSELKRKA